MRCLLMNHKPVGLRLLRDILFRRQHIAFYSGPLQPSLVNVLVASMSASPSVAYMRRTEMALAYNIAPATGAADEAPFDKNVGPVSPAEAHVVDPRHDLEDDSHCKGGGVRGRGREMTTLEAILYARAETKSTEARPATRETSRS